MTISYQYSEFFIASCCGTSMRADDIKMLNIVIETKCKKLQYADVDIFIILNVHNLFFIVVSLHIAKYSIFPIFHFYLKLNFNFLFLFFVFYLFIAFLYFFKIPTDLTEKLGLFVRHISLLFFRHYFAIQAE